ncbi:MAG: polyprenyl synthetase family protein [Clostridia bacterium]|nr:polyprenyl synthetase family protein [Clostridia bacterium]
MKTFEEKYREYQEVVEDALKEACNRFSDKSHTLKEAMIYSVTLGGKRVRPVILLAAADMLGVKREDAMPFAVALELVHTYSLIHDDLPAMDNDDFRRGKPSNHKVFGEAHAVLAGDALLNAAYDICFEQCFKGERFVRAAKYLCEAAGDKGMIAGQSADILYEKKESFTKEDLLFIYKHKTGKLLCAPFAIASVLADGRYFMELDEFGSSVGLLFQLTDDILDEVGEFDALGKTIGKDKKTGKLTCVKLYGLKQAEIEADLCADACLFALERIDAETEFLKELIYFIRARKK